MYLASKNALIHSSASVHSEKEQGGESKKRGRERRKIGKSERKKDKARRDLKEWCILYENLVRN